MTKNYKIDLVKSMRADGKTYDEIAAFLGCSRQNVYEFIKNNGITTRKHERDIEKIRFQGIYDLFVADKHFTFVKLAKVFGGGAYDRALYRKVYEYVTGRSGEVSLTMSNIKNIIAYTGKTFEEIFKERKQG